MRIYWGGVAVTLYALSVAACGGRGLHWVGTAYDSAGVAVVVNTDVGVWAEGREWRLKEALRVGLSSNPTAPRLEEVGDGGVAVDSRGRIHVLDRKQQCVLVYLDDGSYQRTVAIRRTGQGRWGGALRILMGSGDTLMVVDGQNREVSRYAPDGSVAGSFPMVLEEGFPMAFQATVGGVIAEQVRSMPVGNQPTAQRRMDALVLLGTDGVREDTVLTFPPGENMTLDGRGRQYAPEPVWHLTDRLELLFGVSNDYRIAIYSGKRLQRLFTKPFERRAVSDLDRTADLGELERRWVGLGLTAEGLKRLRENYLFAEHLPVFHSLAAGPAGTIWVQYIQAPGQLKDVELAAFRALNGWGAPKWDVFDAGGRFLGLVNGPAGFFPILFRADAIYGVEIDEAERPTVVKLRIVASSSNGAS